MEDGIFYAKFMDMDNLRWLLQTYQPVCQHIIWIGNTANGNEGNTMMYSTKFINQPLKICSKSIRMSRMSLGLYIVRVWFLSLMFIMLHCSVVSWCQDLGNRLTSFV